MPAGGANTAPLAHRLANGVQHGAALGKERKKKKRPHGAAAGDVPGPAAHAAQGAAAQKVEERSERGQGSNATEAGALAG